MTLGSIFVLFGVMVVLALIPSVSVLTVSARSAAFGLLHGVATTLGIVFGDIIFILLAVYGLAVLAEQMTVLFVLVKYLGAAYLFWLGLVLWRSRPKVTEIEASGESSVIASFLIGLFITLGDQKAILFYLGFFPAFLDLSVLSVWDTGIVIAIAAISIGGAKFAYALMADKASVFFRSTNASRVISRIAGSMMIAVGLFLVIKP